MFKNITREVSTCLNLINFIHGVFTLRFAHGRGDGKGDERLLTFASFNLQEQAKIEFLYLAYETLRRLISSLSIGGFQKEKVFKNVVSMIPRRFFS